MERMPLERSRAQYFLIFFSVAHIKYSDCVWMGLFIFEMVSSSLDVYCFHLVLIKTFCICNAAQAPAWSIIGILPMAPVDRAETLKLWTFV